MLSLLLAMDGQSNDANFLVKNNTDLKAMPANQPLLLNYMKDLKKKLQSDSFTRLSINFVL